MRSDKHWIKKLTIFALILTVVGVGVGWATGMDRSEYDQAFNQAKQSAGQYIPWNNGKSLDRQNDYHERGGMHGGFQKHHMLNPGMAVGGTILGAVVLYWVLKRRKRSGGALASHATTLIPSTTDFLDQWEKIIPILRSRINMGIFSRIKDVFLAETNGLLDKCEQPLNMVNQYLREFDQELSKGQKALANQLFIEKRQAALIAETEAEIKKRERQAKLAVEKGEDHIAKLALQEQIMQEKKQAAYLAQYESIKDQTKTLEEKIGQLLVQSEELNHRRLLLASRANVASSMKNINETVISFHTENVTKGFARVEEKVWMMEAEVDAMAHFSSPSKRSAPQYLDPNLKDDIQRALDELKQKTQE
jgi:phage shock protein A